VDQLQSTTLKWLLSIAKNLVNFKGRGVRRLRHGQNERASQKHIVRNR
jgi:hypothetical protein